MSLVQRTSKLPFLFDDFLTTDWLGGIVETNKVNQKIPAVNVTETDDSFALEIAVPGFAKDDFKIELDKDVLAVFSDISSQGENDKDSRYTKKEFGYSSFRRTFSVPETVNGNEISASYKNGIVHILLPKKEESKILPKRVIAVS